MATAKQIAANRGNALRSTGPRTLEGRKASAMNALKHGMTSQTVLLPDEDPGKFEHFASGMRIYWLPFGAQEDVLVERIIHLAWRLVRLAKIEAGILSVGYSVVDAGAHGENIVAAVFAEYTAKGILEKLCRYESSKERSPSRTIHDLERLHDRRRKEASLPLNEQIGRVRDLAAEVERLSEIGILDSEPGVNDANPPAGGHDTPKAVTQSRAQLRTQTDREIDFCETNPISNACEVEEPKSAAVEGRQRLRGRVRATQDRLGSFRVVGEDSADIVTTYALFRRTFADPGFLCVSLGLAANRSPEGDLKQ